MARFVKFPGTAGSYASTDDVNLLDADTAHLQQSIGLWTTFSGINTTGLSSAIAPQFGDTVGEATTNAGDTLIGIQVPTGLIPVTPGNTYTLSMYGAYSAAVGGDVGFITILYYDSGGGLLGNLNSANLNITGSLQQMEVTLLAPALTAFMSLRFRATVATTIADESLYWDAVCVREGSDGTFVPSLRIVGDLDLRAKLAATDWTPAANEYVLARTDSYSLYMNTAGKPVLAYEDETSTLRFAVSTVATGVANLATTTLKAELEWGVGARFYLDDVQLGTTVSLTGSSIDPAANELRVGQAGANPLDGDVYWAEVRDGIDGPIVAQFNAEDIAIP